MNDGLKKEPAIDSLGGILQRIQKMRDAGKARGKRQCPATHTKLSKRGEANIVFCRRAA